jgi:pilus assembly protein CpaB
MAERRYTTIFAFAVLTAGVATFGIYRVLQAAKAKNKIQTQPVVVALVDVSEGRSIEPASVTVAQWPAGTVPAGAFASTDSVIGRVTRIDVFKGEVIVPGRLAPNGTGPGLQVKITPGKRAIAVRIDDVAGISGMIQPNSRVDVMVTIKDNEKNGGQQVSKLFMSNMRVLAVGTINQVSSDNRPISAPTVTLEVTPVEAERLAIAQGEGRIQLVLRGYGDPDSIRTDGAKSADVLSQLRTAPALRASAPSSNSGGRRSRPDTRPVVEAPPPPVVVQQSAPVAPVKPKVPDTASVQIFKGDKQDTRKFAKPDTVKPPSP